MKKAFTLSEVLITLVIIGVIAAITVPMLMNDTNDKQWNVARQKALATIGEAFRLATVNKEISTSEASAKDFVNNVLAKKYLKIVKTCDNAKDCGFSEKIKRPDGKTTITMPTKWSEITDAFGMLVTNTVENTWIAPTDSNPTTQNYNEGYFFQTLDGFSVNFFYNPYCVVDEKEKARSFRSLNSVKEYDQQVLDVTCFNAIYDMNGTKGPNTVGKDIGFIGSFYNNYSTQSAAVLPYSKEISFSELNKINNDNTLTASQYCKGLDDNDTWVVPTLNELSLIYINKTLVTDTEGFFWSRTPVNNQFDSNKFGYVHFGGDGGDRYWFANNRNNAANVFVLCVRNNTLK